MHSPTFIALACIAANTVVATESPFPGYSVDVLQWEVEPKPGQIEYLNGTVQEVYNQILQINPDFQLAEVSQVADEDRMTVSQVICDNWPHASKNRIEEGVNYLRGVGGRPSLGPGPGKCSRVSCSWDAAIWWCNDNADVKTLDSFDAIANSAQHTVNTCAVGNSVSGQNFEASNWNTIVRMTPC